ncbi:MAG: type I-E CRISPR-associated protein Cse1/CasA, partial [Armatimonadetes bacterium]|nr:type I-E CRISPR-associated protein Cse1/CasA [Armatimonadota bacterium]
MAWSFNLLHEPWIPVLLSAADSAGPGGQRQMGLAEVLIRAHEIREIADPSPLVTVALHRLLLAVLHRVFAPTDERAWEQLWRAGRLPEAPL